MTKVPQSLIKCTTSGEDFRKNTKKYFVTMTNQNKMLHKTNNENCFHSKFVYKYIDFDNIEQAKDFFKDYDKEITKCDICFPKK